MRGVFFVLVLLLISPGSTHAMQYDGEFAAEAGTGGTTCTVRLGLEKKLLQCEAKWGLEGDLKLTEPSRAQMTTWWQVALPIAKQFRLVINRNQNHFTSSDIFRLIRHNQFMEDTTFASLQTRQIYLGYLRSVPFKNLDVVDAVFVESVFDIGALSLTGLQMHFAGFSESGTAGVLQAGATFGTLKAVVAGGWQTDSRADLMEGVVLDLSHNGKVFNGRLVAQRVDPGFLSPLAKTNQFTPNRQGWQLDVSSKYKGIELGLTLRRHTDIERTREYDRLVWKLDVGDKNTSVEWRIQPTPAFVMRYSLGDTLFQMDPINSTLRTDLALGDSLFSFRVDALRTIARLEYKFAGNLRWRLIGKYDFQNVRSHYSVLVEHSLDEHNTHLQLEIGEYDHGNMSAGFNNPSSFRISWRWKF